MLLGDQFVVSTKNELTREPGPRPSPTRRDVQAGPPKLGWGCGGAPVGLFQLRTQTRQSQKDL